MLRFVLCQCAYGIHRSEKIVKLRKEIDQVIMEWMKGSLVLDTLRVGIALSCCNCRRRTVIKSVFFYHLLGSAQVSTKIPTKYSYITLNII